MVRSGELSPHPVAKGHRETPGKVQAGRHAGKYETSGTSLLGDAVCGRLLLAWQLLYLKPHRILQRQVSSSPPFYRRGT